MVKVMEEEEEEEDDDDDMVACLDGAGLDWAEGIDGWIVAR